MYRAFSNNKLEVLTQREGKIVIIARVQKNIDAGGDFYYSGEVKLTIRYLRGDSEIFLTPDLMETSFRRKTRLEGNGSSAGGPR
jgi:hypothetical protein